LVCAAAREFTVDQDGRHTTYAMLSGTLGGLLALHIVNHYLVLRPCKLLYGIDGVGADLATRAKDFDLV